MQTKSLLIGIISFIAGGLLVSVAATTFAKNGLHCSDTSKKVSQVKHVN